MRKSLFRAFDPSDVAFFDTIGSQVNALLQTLSLRDSFQFRDARLLFADCLVKAPLDEAAALYIGRCVELVARPPAGVWAGTTVLTGK